jgi:periplasmic protein TonB
VPMLHDERQSESHLERAHLEPPVHPVVLAPPDTEVQRKRMLIALGILLLALVAVIVRDWDFWFPSRGEAAETAALRKSKGLAPEIASVPAPAKIDRKPVKPATTAPQTEQAPFTATTQRAVLPPLQVEVVAGNRHLSVPAKSSAIHLDVGSGETASGTVTPGGRVSLPTAPNVSVSVPPDYPLLARQMKVQGVVSLQALIARDGTIQELQILSGPEILATAAREAVKQWHFKPYLQNGQPVETQARITVNFTISTN